jgi:hypothetical protein
MLEKATHPHDFPILLPTCLNFSQGGNDRSVWIIEYSLLSLQIQRDRIFKIKEMCTSTVMVQRNVQPSLSSSKISLHVEGAICWDYQGRKQKRGNKTKVKQK